MNNNEVTNVQEANTEAYLNAMRQLEQEKKDAKKAKRKKRRKRIRNFFLLLIGAIIVLIVISPSLFAGDSVSNIKDYINDPENRTQTLQAVVDEYISYDFHSEEKEIKNLYKFGNQAFDKGDIETAGYLFKICAEYSDEYKDKILSDTSYDNMDALLADSAKKACESGNYSIAVDMYKSCENQESIATELKDANYNLAISFIKNNSYADAMAVLSETEGYRYSNALAIWAEIADAKTFNNDTVARSELKARLKDPSSYQETSANCCSLATIREQDGEHYIQMVNYVAIDYSATNSYGGRIKDTYYWNMDGKSISGAGYSKEELEAISVMKKSEVIEKAENA